jgi:hypothetical protein
MPFVVLVLLRRRWVCMTTVWDRVACDHHVMSVGWYVRVRGAIGGVSSVGDWVDGIHGRTHSNVGVCPNRVVGWDVPSNARGTYQWGGRRGLLARRPGKLIDVCVGVVMLALAAAPSSTCVVIGQVMTGKKGLKLMQYDRSMHASKHSIDNPKRPKPPPSNDQRSIWGGSGRRDGRDLLLAAHRFFPAEAPRKRRPTHTLVLWPAAILKAGATLLPRSTRLLRSSSNRRRRLYVPARPKRPAADRSNRVGGQSKPWGR